MFQVINPANGSLLAELHEDSSASISAKFRAAKAAQSVWAATPLDQRLEVLRQFRALAAQRSEELALTLTREVGKPLSQSRHEMKGLQARLDYFIQAGPAALAAEDSFSDVGQGLRERISYEPLGVLANISAWNYPYFVGSNVYAPALLAGNAVLYKPSEFATLSGQAMAALWQEAGLPEGLFTLVLGAGTVGQALLAQPVDGVFFTGSYATGLQVAAAASKRLAKLQLELGGKDPVYVCDDVEVATAAAATADGAFYNAGQSCCSVERLYVQAPIYEAFVEAFLKEVGGFVMGDPMDGKTYLGPLTRPAQVQVLERQVADAVHKGAKLQAGGKAVAGPGSYFEATVLTNVNHRMELMREESFGPIIGIQKVADDAEALALMNDTEYGLTAGVYSRDRARAEALLAGVRVGSAYWNCCDRVSPRLPWSGRGHSGLGTVLGTQGIRTFVQPKAWHLRGSW